MCGHVLTDLYKQVLKDKSITGAATRTAPGIAGRIGSESPERALDEQPETNISP